jgi:hypothetical protein
MCVGIGIGLLGTTQAFADPVTVTSGDVGAMVNGGTFTIRGDGLGCRHLLRAADTNPACGIARRAGRAIG